MRAAHSRSARQPRLTAQPTAWPQGTILPGVTRRSIIELARDQGYTVEETPVSVHEAMEADEIFTTGVCVWGGGRAGAGRGEAMTGAGRRTGYGSRTGGGARAAETQHPTVLACAGLRPTVAPTFPAPRAGTAVVVSAVGSLTYKGQRRQFGTPGEPTPTALRLYDALTGLQVGWCRRGPWLANCHACGRRSIGFILANWRCPLDTAD